MIANKLFEKNCFNCGMDDHWFVNCPNLSQAQRNKLAGIIYISISGKEFNGIIFLQNESSNQRVVATRKTLDLLNSGNKVNVRKLGVS